MRSYGGLWERIVSEENLRAAWKRVRRGHVRSPEVLAYGGAVEANLAGLREALLGGTWRPGAFRQFKALQGSGPFSARSGPGSTHADSLPDCAKAPRGDGARQPSRPRPCRLAADSHSRGLAPFLPGRYCRAVMTCMEMWENDDWNATRITAQPTRWPGRKACWHLPCHSRLRLDVIMLGYPVPQTGATITSATIASASMLAVSRSFKKTVFGF